MIIKWFKIRLAYSWFADCYTTMFLIMIMSPFAVGVMVMIIWKIYFLNAIFTLILILSMILRDSPASNISLIEGKKRDIVRKILAEEWIMRGKGRSIVKIETNHQTQIMETIRIYGFDIKENWSKKYLFGDSYKRFWILDSSWTEWSWGGSRTLTKKEKEKYNVDTLQAKILLAND